LTIAKKQNTRLRRAFWVGAMRHYRINKVAKLGGPVIKKKDVLAASDQEALSRARAADDCPVCEVLKDGQRIGTVV
jgi:hypothetical protein